MSQTVAQPGPEHDAMSKKWAKLRTVEAGTEAMRKAGEKYLTKFAAEGVKPYANRLSRSVLLNGVRRAKTSLAGKIFSKPVTMGEDNSANFIEWANDIDLQGNDLHQFAKRIFDDALLAGLTHIYVEFPDTTGAETLADEQGARPYLIHIKPENLIGGLRKIVDGREILMQIRWFETTQKAGSEEFTTVDVNRIRVIEHEDLENPQSPIFVRIFEEQDGGEFEEMTELQRVVTLDRIPLVTFYTDRTGFLTSRLPLEDLADKNIEHWNSASDQRNILTFARFPQQTAVGVPKDFDMEIGPNRIHIAEDKDAKFGVLETSGAAIAAGRTDMEDLKNEMQMLAMEPLMPGSGNPTATGRALDTAEANSALQSMALGLKDTLENAIAFMGDWSNEQAGSVNVNTEFGLTFNEQVHIDALLRMRAGGDLSQATLWEEQKRRGVLDEAFDPEEEKQLIDDEGPALGLIPPAEPANDEEETEEVAQPSNVIDGISQ